MKQSLTNHTWFKLQNTFASEIYLPNTVQELINILNDNTLPYLILGNGSNVLLGDFDGIVIKTGNLKRVAVCKDHIIADAGVLPMNLLSECMINSRCGFEFISTIPGTIGGMAMMNAGAHGDCMANHVRWVEILYKNAEGKYEKNRIERTHLVFEYRKSSIPENSIITRVAMNTVPIDPDEAKTKIGEMIRYINSVQPRSMTLGSTFKNPGQVGAWKLIDGIDRKLTSADNVEFSEVHRNFLINKGHATKDEALQLIKQVQREVYNQTGMMLELEIRVY